MDNELNLIVQSDISVKYRLESCERLKIKIHDKLDKYEKKLNKLKKSKSFLLKTNIIVSALSATTSSTGIIMLATGVGMIAAIPLIGVSIVSGITNGIITYNDNHKDRKITIYKNNIDKLNRLSIEFEKIFSLILDNGTISDDEYNKMLDLQEKINNLK